MIAIDMSSARYPAQIAPAWDALRLKVDLGCLIAPISGRFTAPRIHRGAGRKPVADAAHGFEIMGER